MTNAWVVFAVVLAAVVAVGIHVLTGRRMTTPIVFTDEREERLTRRVAREVGCSVAQALPAVRQEIDMSPNQPDDTLIKRAAYHYRQSLPERSCQTYRDPAHG